jgi:hypothetical protein
MVMARTAIIRERNVVVRPGAARHEEAFTMRKHFTAPNRCAYRITALVAGLACTLAYLVVPAPVALASTHKSPAICRYLDDQVGSAKFTAAVGKDIKAKNFKALKELFLDLFNSIEKLSTTSAVRSAPADVRAAVKTIAHSVPLVKADIDKSTSIMGLLKVLESVGKTPGVHQAEDVLNNYANAVCGG